MKAAGNTHQLLNRAIGLFAILVLLVPAKALADDVPSGAVDTGGVVENTANEVTPAGGEATTEVTEAVGTASGGAGEAPDEARITSTGLTADSDAMDGFLSTATGFPIGTMDGTASGRQSGVAGPATSPIMTWSAPQSEENGSVGIHPRRRLGGLRLIHWSVTGLISANGLNQVIAFAVMDQDQDDPCIDDAERVCVGLLYGLGDFVRRGADVLGIVATTGIGVIGLMMIALSLGITGWGAILAASRRSAVATGSAG